MTGTNDVAALTARLGMLSADQNPEDLSRTLRITFEGREIYKRYLSFLDGDVTRAKASFGVLVSYIYFSASVYWTQHLSAVFM